MPGLKEDEALSAAAVGAEPVRALTVEHKPAGHIDDLPARFFWLVDLLVMILAFAGSYAITPSVRSLVGPGTRLEALLVGAGFPGSMGAVPLRPPAELAGIILLVVPATLIAMDLLKGYGPLLRVSRARLLFASIVAPMVAVGTLAALQFLLRLDHISRTFVVAFALLTATGFFVYRMTLRVYKLRRYRAGHYAQNILIVAVPVDVDLIAETIVKGVPTFSHRIAGCLVPPGVRTATPSVPVLGTFDDLGDLLVHTSIQDVIAVSSPEVDPQVATLVERCDYLRVTLRIVPRALLGLNFRDLVAPRVHDGLPIPALELRPLHHGSDAVFVKRVMDVLVSALLLIVLAPVFLLIAAAIKFATPQLPVFYRWSVVGYQGRRFVGYKFSTMDADADARKGALAHLNEMSGPVFKIKNDPRVTPFGRWLRKYSLNELPQLWSVLKGDMSLVGPRPAFPSELRRYEYWQKRKLTVKPGMTCLWQVRGRNAISDFDEWVRMDLEYIASWSLWLDVKILIWTVAAVVRGTGS